MPELTQQTKEELQAEKQTVDSMVSLLMTKEGADTFISVEKGKIDSALSGLRTRPLPDRLVSMFDFLTMMKDNITSYPEQTVGVALDRLMSRTEVLAEAIKALSEEPKEVP